MYERTLQFFSYAMWGQNYFNISDYSSQVSTCMTTINNYGILKKEEVLVSRKLL